MLLRCFCRGGVFEKQTKLAYENILNSITLMQNCAWDPKAPGGGAVLGNTGQAQFATPFQASSTGH